MLNEGQHRERNETKQNDGKHGSDTAHGLSLPVPHPHVEAALEHEF